MVAQRPQSKEHTLAALKKATGTKLVFRAPDEVSRPTIRKYALSIGDFNPLYLDREFARQHGLRDVMAPPTLICDSFQYMNTEIDERGDMVGRHPLRPVIGLRAGNDYEFFQPVHPDDIITAYWEIKEPHETTGRSGALIFQDIEVSFYNQRNELLTRNTEVMVYRPPASSPEKASP